MLISNGHRRLQAVFADNGGLVQAHEAKALDMPRQTLNDILRERRGVTVAQSVAIRRRYRIPVSAWCEGA